MNVNNVVRTITIRGTSEGIDELTSKLGKLAGAQENVAVVSETSAKRVLSLEDAWKKQSLKLDEAARSQAAIARETKIADGALREGLVTQQQHAERLNLISQKYAVATVQAGKFATQTGLNRYEILNFSRQIQDVGVSLAGGQSPFVVLAQQGSQIADIFQATNGSVRGFASQAIGWLGRFATSVAGAATGAFAIGAGALYAASSWAESQREIDKALIGIGRRSGVTVNDINQIARSSASATGLSVDEARTAALEFVKTGAIFKDNIKAATDVTRNFAIVTGQDAKDAAQELAKSLASPLEGADALNTKLGFLDGRTREYIATLVSQNQKQEAQAVLLRNLAPAIQEATNTLGPFERAWNAVANAASNAKNAVGAALTPRTDEQRRDALAQQVGQATPSSGFLPGTPVSSGDILRNSEIKRAKGELDNLNETLRETARARALAFGGEVKISSDADEAVRALLPYIDQLKKVEEQLNKIKAAQGNSGAKDRQGLGGSNEAAARAGELLAISMKNVADETDRANAIALQLMQTYNTSSREIANMRAGLADQLVAASAVGGQARMAAQEQATYNDLIRQGKTEQDAAGVAAAQRAVTQAQITTQAKEQAIALQLQLAVMRAVTGQQQIQAQYQATINQLVHDGVPLVQATAVAEAQRANSLAQVNAEADRQLKTLRQEGELIRASSDAERDRIAARQTYQNLLDKGTDSYKAQAVASQQLANAEAKRFEAERRASEEAIRNIQSRADAWKAVESGVLSWSVANDVSTARELRNAKASEDAAWWQNRAATSMFGAAQAAIIAFNAFVPFSTRYVDEAPSGLAPALQTNKSGLRTQFNPDGYKSSSSLSLGSYEDQINRALGTGSSAFDAYQQLLSTGLTRAPAMNEGIISGGGSRSSAVNGGVLGLDTEKLSTLERLIATMPKEQQISSTEGLLATLQQQAPSLARDENITRLTESLDQLRSATDANTSATQAVTDVLSPYYSQDPRASRLGFRAFAGGGIMTPWGEMPLHKYDGGGVATSPQVAMFGEGSTPEAYVPVPSGRIPVELRQPANSNDSAASRPIVVHVSMSANVSRDDARRTGFQIAQEMKRRLG